MSNLDEDRRKCVDCCVPLNKVKVRVTIFTSIATFLLVVVIGGNAWTILAGDGKKVKDAQQDGRIEHTEEKINEFLQGQKDVVAALNKFREIQVEVVTTLERLENKVD